MRKLQISFLVIFPFLFLSSCKKPCNDGYSGEDCEIAVSDRYVGSYTHNTNCNGSTSFGPNFIAATGSNPFKFTISPLYGFNWIVTADINSNSVESFTIASQQPDGASPGFLVEGTGTRNPTSGTVNISYSVISSTGTNACTAIMYRQ